MENGVDRSGSARAETRRAWAKDAIGAIALAEGAIATHVAIALPAAAHAAFPERNAFGDPVAVERAPRVDAVVARFAAHVASGARATLIAGARDLATAREHLAALRARGAGTVVHAIAEEGEADVVALADLGWGVLFAAGVEESMDLALVARRAAEDSGTPFVVVHTRRGSARHVEAVAPPSRELVEVFVGAPASTPPGRARSASEPPRAPAPGRAFAERVPFALASALRELESLTGRKKDVIERLPAGDAPVMLVAMGELGDALLASVERLRATGLDVGAVKVTSLRPFPGPRLVKAMQRALAISVLESVDDPLAQSNPLTREVKAAFADAMTWAPEYPGIGRIPRIASGVVRAGYELEPEDVDAVVHNMLADERGARHFVLGGERPLVVEVDPGRAPPPAPRTASHAIAMRGRVRDAETAEACAELCAAVVSSALGLRVCATVRRASANEGEGFAFDLLAARERPRGGSAPFAVRLVAIEDAALLAPSSVGNPLARLADGGTLAVPTSAQSADAVWSEIPAFAKAIVFDRGGHVVGFAPPEESDAKARRWMVAASFAGLALACGGGVGARPPVDGSLVAREIAEALRAAVGPEGEDLVARGASLGRRAFEARVEVPRATVERDGESIRIGRRDARASQRPAG